MATTDYSIAQSGAPILRGVRIASICDRIAEWGIYTIIALVPLTVAPYLVIMYGVPKLAVLRILTLVVLLALAVRAISVGKVRFVRTPLDLPIIAFLGVSVLSTVFSVSPMLSIFGLENRSDGLLTLLNFALLYFIGVNVLTNAEQIRRLAVVAVAAGTANALFGLVQWFRPVANGDLFAIVSASSKFGYRIHGTNGNPDFFANYLAMLVPLAIGLLFISQGRRERLFFSFSIVLLIVALFLSGTRAAWLALVLVIFLLPVVWRVELLTNARWIGPSAAVVLTLALAFETGSADQVRITLTASQNPVGSSGSTAALAEAPSSGDDASIPSVAEGGPQQRQEGDSGVDGSSAPLESGDANKSSSLLGRLLSGFDSGGSGRLEIWDGGIQIIRDNPVLGTGPSTFTVAWAKYANMDWIRLRLAIWPDKAHNEFIEVAANTGLLGLGAYLWVLVAFTWQLWSWLRKRHLAGQYKSLGMAFLLAWLSYLVVSFFLFAMVDTGAVFWMVMAGGMGIALAHQSRVVEIEMRLPMAVKAFSVFVAIGLALFLAFQSALPVLAQHYLWQASTKLHTWEAEVRSERAALARQAAQLNHSSQWTLTMAARSFVSIGAEEEDDGRRRQYLNQAVRLYTEAIARNPKDPSLYYERGIAFETYGDHMLDAAADYAVATRIFPSFYWALEKQLKLARHLGRLNDAIIAGRGLERVFPHKYEVLYGLGQDYLLAGRAKDAITTLKKAAILDGNNPDLRLLLGMALEADGQLDQAAEEYTLALTLNPKLHMAEQSLSALKEKQEGKTR